MKQRILNILLIGLIGIIIMILFRRFFVYGVREHLKIELPENYDKNELEESIGNYIAGYIEEKKDELRGKKGRMGEEGKRGPRGFPGSTFLSKGYIRSLAKPELVLNRLSGNGTRAVPFLDKEQMTPEQTWTWESDKTIRNGYYNDGDTQCLTALDDVTGAVYLQSCKPEDKMQHWRVEDGRIKWLGNMSADGQTKNQKCLTLKTIPSLRGQTINNKAEPVAELKNFEVAILKNCDRCDKSESNCSIENQLEQKWHM